MVLRRVERSADVGLLLQVTKVVTTWVTTPTTLPTALGLKERAVFVLKMAGFETINSPELHKAYLEMVHTLHTTPELHRPELLERIEPAFMVGLRTRNSTLRNAFFELLHRNVGRSRFAFTASCHSETASPVATYAALRSPRSETVRGNGAAAGVASQALHPSAHSERCAVGGGKCTVGQSARACSTLAAKPLLPGTWHEYGLAVVRQVVGQLAQHAAPLAVLAAGGASHARGGEDGAGRGGGRISGGREDGGAEGSGSKDGGRTGGGG